MWLTGDYAEAVLRAAREWKAARMAAINHPILRFETTDMGNIPVSNKPVWDRLAEAEAALSVAITKHESVDP